MPRPKSLLVSMAITQAGRAHDCRFNPDHRISKGTNRLTIKDDGDEHHYCLECAKTFLARDLVRLQNLSAEISQLLST